MLGPRESCLLSPQVVSGTLTCCVNLFMKAAVVQCTLKQFCLVYTFPLRTWFIILVMLPNWNSSARQLNQRKWTGRTTPDRHLSRITWTRNVSAVVSFAHDNDDEACLHLPLVKSIYPARSGRRLGYGVGINLVIKHRCELREQISLKQFKGQVPQVQHCRR